MIIVNQRDINPSWYRHCKKFHSKKPKLLKDIKLRPAYNILTKNTSII